MTLEEALYSYLKDVAGLKALVGDRIYPVVIPQKADMPAVAFQRVSGVREHTMGDDPGLAHPRIQFSCYGQTYSSAKNTAQEVRKALQDQRNTTWGGAGGVKVQAIMLENELDLPWEPDSRLFCAVLDFTIWHEE